MFSYFKGGKNGTTYTFRPRNKRRHLPWYEVNIERLAKEMMPNVAIDVFATFDQGVVILVPKGTHRKAAFRRFRAKVEEIY